MNGNNKNNYRRRKLLSLDEEEEISMGSFDIQKMDRLLDEQALPPLDAHAHAHAHAIPSHHHRDLALLEYTGG
jgi:hypothetical protein